MYTCLNPENGKILAIKEMNINPQNKQTIGPSFGKNHTKRFLLPARSNISENEIIMLSSITHKNVLTYHGYIKSDKKLKIIMDYIPTGSLKMMIQEFGAFPKPLIKNYAKQILEAIAYIHSLGTIVIQFLLISRNRA